MLDEHFLTFLLTFSSLTVLQGSQGETEHLPVRMRRSGLITTQKPALGKDSAVHTQFFNDCFSSRLSFIFGSSGFCQGREMIPLTETLSMAERETWSYGIVFPLAESPAGLLEL